MGMELQVSFVPKCRGMVPGVMVASQLSAAGQVDDQHALWPSLFVAVGEAVAVTRAGFPTVDPVLAGSCHWRACR